VAWLNHPKSVQVCQDRYTSMAWIKKNQSSLHKRHTGQEPLSCGQPFRDNPKYESTSLLQTFLPCSRKSGLFGHIVAKSRKAWQTLELCPTWISEVHQTYSCHRKSIWACRECLGHLICKKKKAKILIFRQVIPRTSLLQIDYKSTTKSTSDSMANTLTTNTSSWLTDYKSWLQTNK